MKYDPVTTEMTHNAMIQTCDRELLERSGVADFSEPGPIFILGMPRSGSTLIEQILASHSQVEGGGELPYIVMLTSNLGGADKKRYPDVLDDMSVEQLRAVGQSYLYHTRSHRKGTQPYFTDKMPANFAHVGLIHMALPNARIIDARRHPLDTCIGNFRQMFAQGKNMTYDLYELAEYYLEYDRIMAHWDTMLPGRVLRVHYEDVVADLQGQTQRLLDYCGLPFEDACLEFHRNERPVNTASSEQVRQPIYARFCRVLEKLRIAPCRDPGNPRPGNWRLAVISQQVVHSAIPLDGLQQPHMKTGRDRYPNTPRVFRLHHVILSDCQLGYRFDYLSLPVLITAWARCTNS